MGTPLTGVAAAAKTLPAPAGRRPVTISLPRSHAAGSYNNTVKLFAITVAAMLPWLAGLVWLVVRYGPSVLDGRETPAQASRLRSFGAR
jgi:hypothetical protein